MLAPFKSGPQIEDYPVGTRCEVYDRDQWRTAKVISVDNALNSVTIHFEGWESTYDETIDLLTATANKIAPLWTNLKEGTFTGQRTAGAAYDLSYDLAANAEEFKAEMQTLTEVTEVLTKGGSLDEKQMTWMSKYKYVESMLKAKVTDANSADPFKFLQGFMDAVLLQLKTGKTSLKDEDNLIRFFTRILCIDQENQPDRWTYYSSMLKSTQPADGKFASARNLPRERVDTPSASPPRVMLLNRFCESGGMDHMRGRLRDAVEDFKEGRKGKKQTCPIYFGIYNIIYLFKNIKYVLNDDYQVSFFQSLRLTDPVFVRGALQTLTRDQVYEFAGKKTNLFDSFCSNVSSLIRGSGMGGAKKVEAQKYQEMTRLELILFFLKAPYIVAQRRGMAMLKLYVKALNKADAEAKGGTDDGVWEVDDRVSATSPNWKGKYYPATVTSVNDDGSYNIAFDDGEKGEHVSAEHIKAYEETEGGGYAGNNYNVNSYGGYGSYGQEPPEPLPTVQFLTSKLFFNWLETNKIIDIVAADERLFQQSAEIFKYLAKNGNLSDAHLDILLGQARTEEGSKLLSSLAEQLDQKTLVQMYKRQTDGIELADYQKWQLEALTSFTLSAVKVTQDSKRPIFFGLDLLWEMLRPENEAKIDPEIITKAQECLNILFADPLFSKKRKEFIDMCVDGLQNNSGEVNALTVFTILMKGTTGVETAQKIERNLNEYKLIPLFFTNSTRYNEAASKRLRGISPAPKEPADQVLQGVSPHGQQVNARLRFLKFVGQNSDFNLTVDSVEQLWKLYVTGAVCAADTTAFLKWLPATLREEKKLQSLYSVESRAKLFDLLSSPAVDAKGEPVPISPEWQRCFTQCFKSTNKERGFIELAPLNVLDHKSLLGKEKLWKFALESQDAKVRSASQRFLGSIYVRLGTKEMSEAEKSEALDEFVAKSMGALSQARAQSPPDTVIIQSTLELLKSVLGRIKLGEMIKRPLYKKGEQVKAHWKRDGGTLYECEVMAVHEDGTYYLKYADGDQDQHALESYLREKSGKKRVPEPVELTDIEQHVENRIAKEQKYFGNVFSSLDDGGVVSARAWDVLGLLPPSDTTAKQVKAIANQDAKTDWEALFPSAPVKLLYTLRIIDPNQMDKKSNPLNGPEWRAKFQGPGLGRLATVLRASSDELVADPLARIGLSKIFSIFRFFLGQDAAAAAKAIGLDSAVQTSLALMNQLVVPADSKQSDADKAEADKGKAEAIAELFAFLVACINADSGVLAQVNKLGDSAWESATITALVKNQNPTIQESFAKGIDLLCTGQPTDSKGVKASRMQLTSTMLRVTNSRFGELDTERQACAQYMLLMGNLISKTDKVDEKSGREIGTSLAGLIKRHPIIEASPKQVDPMLGALLNLTAEVIKKIPSLQSQLGAKGPEQTTLLKPVYDMLFTVPTLENSYQRKARPPQCKNPSSRKAGFALLSALVNKNQDNLGALVRLLKPNHMQIHNDGAKPNEWEFEPAWKADEQEREGYTGLVNCGNTCYINAALQQVFMQPQLRANILSMSDYSHPSPTALEWKRDELKGTQWVMGKLQETNSRAITPMYFHKRFEDMDWDNKGKPVRGPGAAGHMQADSNAFLQSLLSRIEDRIKSNEGQKELVKDVCGLKFCEQIVGTRSAPYINLKYRPSTWVGPIQVNVAGHKTLSSCLKAHVEWKTRQRKVSEPGFYGQSYRKTNVNVFQRTVFDTMPQCLMICLNRMAIDSMGRPKKLNHKISFPMELDMRPFSSEALNSKLPRGSDIGSTKDSKKKPPAPATRPREYYQYKLMGVIVHSGRTLQSGHYYSYIRERPPADKWYCFNDSSISAFDVNKLPEETFGSEDDSSWKCSTAYVLFYDKVPVPQEVQVKASAAKSKMNLAGVASLVTKLKAKAKKSRDAAKARVSVPQGMLRKIWMENEVKWRDTNTHDRAYGDALFSMVSQFKSDFKGGPPVVRAGDVTDEPSNVYDEVTRTATRYLFMTLARCKGREARGWQKWTKLIKSLYTNNVASSLWLCSMFTNASTGWFDLLYASYDNDKQGPVSTVREGAVEIISEAMRTMVPTEKRNFKISISNPARRVRSSTPRREAAYTPSKDGKGAVEGKDAKGSPAGAADGKTADGKTESKTEVVPSPRSGYILTILDRVLRFVVNPSALPRSLYSSLKLLGAFSTFSADALEYLRALELFDDFVNLVDPIQVEKLPGDSDDLPKEYFALLNLLVDGKDQYDKVFKPNFIDRLLFESYSKARAEPICKLIVAGCAADAKRLELVTQRIAVGIKERNYELTRPLYRVLDAILASSKDEQLTSRCLNAVLSLYQDDETKFKETDFAAEMLIRICKKYPRCAALMAKRQPAIDLIRGALEGKGDAGKPKTYKVGDHVVSMFKPHDTNTLNANLYGGCVEKVNGDGTTCVVKFYDGDVWEEAPFTKMRLQTFPRLDEKAPLEELKGAELEPRTVKGLQFVLRTMTRSEIPAETGIMDAETVQTLQEQLYVTVTSEFDSATIIKLKEYLQRDFLDRRPQKVRDKDPDRLDWTSGEMFPVTRRVIRKWINEEVVKDSQIKARKDMLSYKDRYQKIRDKLGYHKKSRRYTASSKFKPHGRSTQAKLDTLSLIAEGKTLPADDTAYDSEDERTGREFKVGDTVDLFVERQTNRGWKAGTVVRTSGEYVYVQLKAAAKKATNNSQYPTVTALAARVRAKRNRAIPVLASSPCIVSPQGIFSSRKA